MPRLVSTPRRCAPRPRFQNIWYMGAKTRLLEGFIDEAAKQALPEGGRLLDLFCGTGVVSRFLARDYTVIANDAQEMCRVLAEAHLVHGKLAELQGFLASLDPEAELAHACGRNRRALEEQLAPALELEDRALAGELEPARYLELLATTPVPGQTPSGACFGGARGIYSSTALERRRRDPRAFPYTLLTAYYGNVYLGLRQAIEADSLRYAISQLASRKRRIHYLSALLHAVSVSTSGTSHFAQPTDPRRPRERARVLQRRAISISERFHAAEASQRRELRAARLSPDNRALSSDFVELIGPQGFRCGPLDAVYADPPYTADNYSRFYHVLEELARYRYPRLKRTAQGLTKGRYPEQQLRFRSGFCSRPRVEAEWRRLIAASADSGANLLASYASPSGLLLKTYHSKGLDEEAALARFQDLFRERYSSVSMRLRDLEHSGQGDGFLGVQEILMIATGAKKTACGLPKAR